MAVTLNDNTSGILKALDLAKRRALTGIGATAEAYAKRLLTEQDAVDTGRLRASVSHAVQDDTVYVGTSVEYAAYIEYGTGKYCSLGGGTWKDRWFYVDELGHPHMGTPQRPRPYLKPAIADHLSEYRAYIEAMLRQHI